MSSTSGVLLYVNARWIGYTKNDNGKSFVLGHVLCGFVDGEGVRPVGEDSYDSIVIPYGNAYFYRNPIAGYYYSLVQPTGDPNIGLNIKSSRMVGEFRSGLTFQAISELPTTASHSVALDYELYEFDG